jgi:hypothetical protein
VAGAGKIDSRGDRQVFEIIQERGAFGCLTAGDAVETRLLLRRVFGAALRDVQLDGERAAVQLFYGFAVAARHTAQQHDDFAPELARELLHVQAFMIELHAREDAPAARRTPWPLRPIE